MRGWCANASQCPKSHDIDIILDSEGSLASKKKRKRRKNKTSGENSCAESIMDTESISEQASETQSGSDQQGRMKGRVEGHRAGFDAFMTGFIFAFFTARYGHVNCVGTDTKITLGELGVEDFKNKVFLSGKDIPLHISKSAFTKNSKEHKEKMEMLQKMS